MALGNVALGLASLVIGAHHLRRAADELSRGRRQGFSGVSQREAALMPVRDVRVPGHPFHNSGRRLVRTRNGAQTPMRLRSFKIRTLDDRIAYLRRLADEGKRDPAVYAFARKAVSKRCGRGWCIPEKDNLREAQAVFGELRRALPPHQTARDVQAAKKVFRNTRRNVRYTSDILGVDTYQKPGHTLALGTADCDDFSSLACSSLLSLGIPCRYKVIRTKGAKDWNHIYAQAGFPRANPQHWVSMDASVDMPFGWEAPKRAVAASRVFRVG